jgi:hypothetical protein
MHQTPSFVALAIAMRARGIECHDTGWAVICPLPPDAVRGNGWVVGLRWVD